MILRHIVAGRQDLCLPQALLCFPEGWGISNEELLKRTSENLNWIRKKVKCSNSWCLSTCYSLCTGLNTFMFYISFKVFNNPMKIVLLFFLLECKLQGFFFFLFTARLLPSELALRGYSGNRYWMNKCGNWSRKVTASKYWSQDSNTGSLSFGGIHYH